MDQEASYSSLARPIFDGGTMMWENGKTVPCTSEDKYGCCDGEMLVFCRGGYLYLANCAGTPKCGWSGALNHYACGTNGGSSSKSPKSCDPDMGVPPNNDGILPPPPEGGMPPSEFGPPEGGPPPPPEGGMPPGEFGPPEGGPPPPPPEGGLPPPGDAGGGGCGSITTFGCCRGEMLDYCENNQMRSTDCKGKPKCGWDATKKKYGCGTNGGSDPSGKHSKTCSLPPPVGDGSPPPPVGDGSPPPPVGDGSPPPPVGDGSPPPPVGDGSPPPPVGDGSPPPPVGDGSPPPPVGDGSPPPPVGDGGPPSTCYKLTSRGCCRQDVLDYCQNKQIKSTDCKGKLKCGWNASQNKYTCGTSGGADPKGTYPQKCEAYMPDMGTPPPVGDGSPPPVGDGSPPPPVGDGKPPPPVGDGLPPPVGDGKPPPVSDGKPPVSDGKPPPPKDLPPPVGDGKPPPPKDLPPPVGDGKPPPPKDGKPPLSDGPKAETGADMGVDQGQADQGKETGTEGAKCFPNDTCSTGLKCYSNLCVKAPDSGFTPTTNTRPDEPGCECSMSSAVPPVWPLWLLALWLLARRRRDL